MYRSNEGDNYYTSFVVNSMEEPWALCTKEAQWTVYIPLEGSIMPQTGHSERYEHFSDVITIIKEQSQK